LQSEISERSLENYIVPTIAVYGSAFIKADSPEYLAAYEIGKGLGVAGFTIMTGGYKGIMEAASRGAAEVGAHVVGVTSAPIEVVRRQKPNQWVERIVPYDTLRERIVHLAMRADGYVVMPGGVGTMSELLLVWDLMRAREVPPRPLVCYRPYWEGILAPLRAEQYVADVYWEMLSFASTPGEVIEMICAGV
jgi:uncharacterized protein (TIGR00730 family)